MFATLLHLMPFMQGVPYRVLYKQIAFYETNQTKSVAVNGILISGGSLQKR